MSRRQVITGIYATDTRAHDVSRQFDTYLLGRTVAEKGIVGIRRPPEATAGHAARFTTWTGHRSTIRYADVDDPHIAEIAPEREGVPLISVTVSTAPLRTVADGHRQEHQPGALVLTCARRSLHEHLLARGSVAAVRVDRDQLQVSDRAIADALISGASPAQWYANLVSATAQVVTGLELDPPASPHPDGIDRYAASILELTLRTIANVGPEMALLNPDQRRRHTEQFIEEHLLDAALDATAIAVSLGISVRQLARDLQDGPSAAVMIQNARLRHADRLLRDPAYDGLTIARVAQLCRFSSQSLFSRRYKSYLGVTPRQARAARREHTS